METIDTALLVPVPAQLFVEVLDICAYLALLLSPPRLVLGRKFVAHMAPGTNTSYHLHLTLCGH